MNSKNICSNCGEEKEIVNKHFKLCRECNNKRLYGNKYGKRYDVPKKKASIVKRAKNKSEKEVNEKIKADEEFYEKCFNQSDHKCEECGAKLPKRFRDEDGKVIARWQYSHIVPKSIAPELRHNIENINILCFECHEKWENGDKGKMKIFAKNYQKYPQFLERYKKGIRSKR